MMFYYHFVILTTFREEESHVFMLRFLTYVRNDMTI